MGSQDEIRRLMKEAKQKPSATAKAKPQPPAKPSDSQAQKPSIPAGFFDDSLADAKARNVDVQKLAATQLESEWEAFQEFAQEVEQQTAKEDHEQVQESKEREAVEQLENMQYVDRYRVVLERATSLRNGGKRGFSTQKRKLQDSGDDLAEDGVSAVETVSEYKKKHKKPKKQQLSDSDDSDFDPCNWRSRGI